MNELKLPLMMYRSVLDKDRRIKCFRESEYMGRWLLAVSVLNRDILYKSPIHGLGHIERVMLLGALIAKSEALSERETQLLLFACAYHDTGRVDDSKDDFHGRRSAEIISSAHLLDIPGDFTEQEIAVLKASISTHSMHDSSFEENCILFGVKDESLPLAGKICFCLKDADNLDRVRLGDLDEKHLRHGCSRRMVPTAQFIFDSYIKY